MRIMWLSNSPWTCSGYGQQTRLFVPRLQAAGNQMAICAYHGLEGGILNLGDGIVVYPKRYHPYGNDIVSAHCQHYKADVMMSLMDVWVMEPEGYPPVFKWVPWFPVDHEPMPPKVREKLTMAWRRIAMSKSGVKASQDAGLDCFYVPHGTDTKVFNPSDRMEARDRLHWPKDKFIVLTVAMNKGNPSRKNFVEMAHAFRDFHAKHKDTWYFLQTDRGEGVDGMVNLPELFTQLGLVEGQDYAFPVPYQNAVGFPPEYMADMYRAANVHLLASAGEGFGIPTLEAQACGTPVIVGDWTASAELCFGGHKIDRKDAEPQYTPLAAYQFRPRVRAIEIALHAEYKHPTPMTEAVKLAHEYDADKVFENYWKPTLVELEKGIAQ